MKIALASDHGGYRLKEAVKASLLKRGMDVQDLGCHSEAATDYPDYAMEVSLRVSRGPIDEGILICTTGIGMVIAANKYPRIRAALCVNPEMALLARRHNNANILVLGAKTTPIDDLEPLLDAWFDNTFEGGRHDRRVTKIRSHSRRFVETSSVAEEDPEICTAILDEWERQQNTINLIASENYISRAAREAQGSVMTNKYAEGYPRKRWYNGCEYIDTTEQLAIDRAKELFGAEHANVQPHCGSSANMAVYLAVLEPGDTILAMSLAHGGHLTHGHKLNVSGRLFNFVSYGVRKDDELLDYEQVERLAKAHKPKLIVVGASAYPRLIDFKRFRKIADDVGAMIMVDMAHIAGLVAARCHPDPVPYAEFVTTTTHKTLRGSRGGLVLCRKEFAKAIDRQVFPGLQGGPLMHAIAAKAVCFHYALGDAFKQYGRQIVANAKVLAEGLKAAGFRLVSGGTDNHLMLVDVAKMGMTGQDAATALDKAGLVVNKNVIPFDENPPLQTSGVRLGTPMVTTRGMKEPEMEMLVALITDVLRSPDDEAIQKRTRGKVGELTARFPVK